MITKLSPLAMLIITNVAMKGGILILAVIKNPFINPHIPPANRVIRIAKGMFTPFLRANAPIMALKARTDPTDKSIPPVMITHVMPTDTIPIIDTCLSMFNIFDSVRKCGDNIDISKAIIAGLEVLNDKEIRVRSDLIEDLAILKEILFSIRSGKLVLAPPERILPAGAQLPKEDEIKQIEEN